MKKRVFIRLGLLVFVLLLIYYGFRRIKAPVKKTTELKKQITWETDIEKAKIIKDRILFWDGDYLVSLDTDGVVKDKVDHMKENLVPFFTEQYCFLYDSQMNKLYQYDGKATLKNTMDIEGELYNVLEQEGNIILHCKREEGEILYALTGKGELDGFFKTEDFILSFDVKNPFDDYVVSELSTSAAGYKSRVYVKKGDLKKYDYPSEVIMAVSKDKDIYVLTEKTLYRLTGTETIKKEVPLTTAILVHKDKIYLLHSGILSTYNKDLKEEDKKVLAANLDQLMWINGSLYGKGKGDLGGQLLTESEFYAKLGPQMEEMDISGDFVISKREHELFIFKLVNEKEETNEGGQENQ
ncbi:MAG: hypothetical protein Q4Q07_01570 [Tissierellia bacterium]|nr:hypothetical protein [Tissierellia bacterium]